MKNIKYIAGTTTGDLELAEPPCDPPWCFVIYKGEEVEFKHNRGIEGTVIFYDDETCQEYHHEDC